MRSYKNFVAIFLLITTILSCSDKEESIFENDEFTSKRSLYVDYISSFTYGIISRNSPIKIRLAKPVENIQSGQSIEQNVFDFSPSIDGKAYFEDSRTLIFQPENLLESGQRYEAVLSLNKIIKDIPSDREEFQFLFQPMVQNYDINVHGLKLYNKNDLKKLKVEGELQTADYTPDQAIESALSARQNGKNLTVNWAHASNENSHRFTIENVQRTEDEEEVNISVNGNPIEVDKEESVDVDIPALGDYKVMSTQIMRGKESYISVIFSDPLDDKQNLNGLIELKGASQPRFVVNLNELKVYPTSDLTGSFDLIIHKEVKNSAGYQLKENFVSTLELSQNKPAVRLTSEGEGAILPNSKGLVLPFEAIGLKAVDVRIARIFEDNVLQYLQVNQVGGTSELRRVAKPVVRKHFPLNTMGVTNLNEWNRFTLDLSEVLKAEPGAIYQVSIGFKEQHSLYFCPGEENNEIEEVEEEWGPAEEDSYWDDYENYYGNNYDWSERDNPCSPSYYGDRRSTKKVLFASDLGIIAKRRDNGDLHFFTTNLLNAKPENGVEIEVYDYQQQLIGKGKSDSKGKGVITLDENPFVLVAKKGEQTGYLRLDDGTSLSMSNFNVTGSEVQKGIKGFIYGERGVWRPSDTVHLAFILEDTEENIPNEHPVVMELYDPQNKLYSRKVSAKPVGDIYRFDLTTDKDAPTGNWLAKVKIGGASFTKRVRIETVKPNRLKINLDFDQEKLTTDDKTISADLNVRWLHGAKASGLKAEYEVLYAPVKTTFEDYPNASFDDASKNFYSEPETVFEGRLNEEGHANVNVTLDVGTKSPGALNAIFKGKVFEEGGDFSIDKVTIPYYPYESFVGIQVPEGDKRGMLLTDEKHNIKLVTVDANGRPVSRNGLKVELYKLNWKWWWDNSYDNISNYVGRSYRDPVQTGYASTTNGEGTWQLEVEYPSWGRYYIRITDPVSEHSAGHIVYMDWPGWAGKGKREDLAGASMLEVNVEKEEYKVGEKITIAVPSSEGNRLLVSLETGSEILQTYWLETDDKATLVEFDATSDMAPNVYANITMLQPHAQSENDLPIRLYGVQSIKVVDPQTQLSPQIKMPKELRPEEEFTVTVNEANGRPMAYTLAMVDEGLLDLTGFTTPDPWPVFYAREALGIKTWDLYDNVMGAYGGNLERLLAIGGDGEIAPKEESEANRFKPVVKYLGPFSLKPGESKSHKIKMPQYIGSVKTMVVAAHNGAYGKAAATTPVKQPMMILATLPRVAGPEEIMKLPVNVFAMNDNVKNVSLSVETSGRLKTDGANKKNVAFSKAGDKVVFFDLKADKATGIGKVKVTATSGQLKAVYDVEMNVIPRNPVMTVVDEKVIADGGSWNTQYQPLGLITTNEGTIELSSLPPLNIDQRLDYLIRYPHGCIEQVTSSVFAQLYLNELIDLNEERAQKVQANITSAIDKLKGFQINSGGFAYWPGNQYSNTWGTNYAGHFLIEAKNKGYAVPESMISSWINHQTQQANNWGQNRDDHDTDLTQSYRLYTLALAGSPALGAMNRMKENTDLSKTAKWRLALAYVAAGYKQEAQEMVESLSTAIPENDNRYRYTYGSPTRDEAMILETLIHLDKKEQAFTLLNKIAKKMGESSRWMSTQTTAYCFIAISQYAQQYPVDEGLKMDVEIGSEAQTLNSTEFISQLYITQPDKATSVNLSNNGEAPVYARIIRKGIPLEGNESSEEKNLRMNVTYSDMSGNPINVSNLKQGTDFMAEVSITNPGLMGKYEEMALTQLFPSGWEIINTRLDDTDQYYQQDEAEYVDIRDDRVMHYFDIEPNKKLIFKVLLNASYQGKYYLPAVTTEAMYDENIYAHKAGRWVEVIPE